MSGKKRTYTVYQTYWDSDMQVEEEQEVDVTVIYDRDAEGHLMFRVVKTKPAGVDVEELSEQIVEAIEGEEAAIADWQAEREWSHQQEEK